MNTIISRCLFYLHHRTRLLCVGTIAVALPARAGESIADAPPLTLCNAVQNQVGFIRYPLGTIGAWSTAAGETADVMTRVPRIYPCLTNPIIKSLKDDWRASVSGDPSVLNISYRNDKPPGGSHAALTVSPHLTVFRVSFPEAARQKYVVLDFGPGNVDKWARLSQWTNRSVALVDNRTLRAAVSGPDAAHAYYAVKLSIPYSASGTFGESGAPVEGMVEAAGPEPRVFLRLDATEVIIAVAESFVSEQKAKQYLAEEFTDFDSVQQRCRAAWETVLKRVEMQGDERSRRMAYTALYTMYANIISGGDGSCYSSFYSRPCEIASSAYWQFIGGYQSCCWDNIRGTYPFLALAYPEVMSDILGTYLARYRRDGCLDGDICLFTGTMGHKNIRFAPVLVATANAAAVPADYASLYAALKDNFSNDAYFPSSLRTVGHLVQPESGGFACSRTLEYATGLDALAALARAKKDRTSVEQFAALSDCYTNLWDDTSAAFRLKQADGTWGPVQNEKMTWNPNPAGLFEGTTKDWRFAVPQDPYGLIHLMGREQFIAGITNYCFTDCWFNDYQTCYPYLLYYAGAPNLAQRILRTSWVPMFDTGVMYEGVRPKLPHNGWQTHYAGNAGWLLCSMVGLFPTFAPAGQFIIASPSLNHAVIRNGKHAITVDAKQNSPEKIYIRSIKLDGKPYPSYLVSGERLAAGARIELEMSSDAQSALGPLYLASADGFVRAAELVSPTHLRCVLAPAGSGATAKIHCQTKPARIRVDGREDSRWTYDSDQQMVTVAIADTATVEVFSR